MLDDRAPTAALAAAVAAAKAAAYRPGQRIRGVLFIALHQPLLTSACTRSTSVPAVGAAAQARDAINGNMLALGHQIPGPCVAALAAASCGFPQHIHGYLEGAVSAIATHGELATGAPLDDALAVGDSAREEYYETRLGMLPNQNAMLPVVHVMLEQRRDVLWQEEAAQAINDASFDGEETVRQAIAHGVLTLEGGGVSFGIPSFRDHMKQAAARAPAGFRLTGDVAALSVT